MHAEPIPTWGAIGCVGARWRKMGARSQKTRPAYQKSVLTLGPPVCSRPATNNLAGPYICITTSGGAAPSRAGDGDGRDDERAHFACGPSLLCRGLPVRRLGGPCAVCMNMWA